MELEHGFTIDGHAPLLDAGYEIQGLIDRWMATDYATERPQQPWEITDPPLPREPMRSPERLRLNQLYWPIGATRWGQLTALVTRETAGEILHNAWRPDKSVIANVPGGGEDFVHDWRATTVPVHLKYPYIDTTVDLYVADYYPLVRWGHHIRTTDEDAVVLLRLVDERYWWQQMALCGQCGRYPNNQKPNRYLPSREKDEPWLTWVEFIGLILDELHVTDYELDSISEERGYPDPIVFGKPYESIAVVLDAVCASLGMRLVRRLDGHVSLQSANSRHLLQPISENPEPELDKNEFMSSMTLLGEPHMFGPRGGRLLIAFQRNLQGHAVDSGPDQYYWALVCQEFQTELTYIDESCHPWSQAQSTLGYGTLGVTNRVYVSAYAYFEDPSEDCPTNIEDLKKMAQTLAFEWFNRVIWGWSTDVRWSVSYPYHIRYLCDYLLYDLGTEHPPRPRLVTQGDDDTPVSSVELRQDCRRNLSSYQATFTPNNAVPDLMAMQFRDVPLLPDPAWFEIEEEEEQGGTAALLPGESATAKWVVYDEDAGENNDGAWVDPDTEDGSPGLTGITIHDPGHLACALSGERVRCEWSNVNQRWEACQAYGLRRNCQVTEQGGIEAGQAGTATIHHDGSLSGIEIEVELDWMDMDKDLRLNHEIAAWYNVGEQRWIIDGAEC